MIFSIKPFSNDKKWVELTGTTEKETDRAVLIDFGDSEEWILKSQMEDWPDFGETGKVLIKEWLTEEKGLI